MWVGWFSCRHHIVVGCSYAWMAYRYLPTGTFSLTWDSLCVMHFLFHSTGCTINWENGVRGHMDTSLTNTACISNHTRPRNEWESSLHNIIKHIFRVDAVEKFLHLYKNAKNVHGQWEHYLVSPYIFILTIWFDFYNQFRPMLWILKMIHALVRSYSTGLMFPSSPATALMTHNSNVVYYSLGW